MSHATVAPAGAGLFFLGVSHHTAPLAVRERLALPPEKAAALLAAASTPATSGLRELAVLNTCNRVELYGVATTAHAVEDLAQRFCELTALPRSTLSAIERSAWAADAVRHLFEVAAGLDSQMLGETEILGQVKDAYEAAVARRAAGPVLNRVFQKTFQAAKLARSQTGIGAGQISVANVAVDLALKIFGDLRPTQVLLLGAGEIAEKTAAAFRSRGAQRLTVASRRMETAAALATSLGGAALPFDQVPARLADFDIVVGSTAASHTVVTHAMTHAALRTRPGRPLFCLDLALPRDFDATVASLSNVFLYNLDDLAAIADENLAQRRAEAERCRTLLATRADALWRQLAPSLPAVAPGPDLPTPEVRLPNAPAAPR